MQSSSDNNNTSVAAAMMAALVTRRPATNEAPSHNLMRVYLDKLKELVPHCPKNRNVSKLELIQHVIDYINDLQEALQNGGSDSDSPPSSPSAGGPDPISFSEAFSHLTFDDAASFYGSGPAAVYTSDGASDYDSRGSSPVNHQHSDADYSSDEFSPGSCPPQQQFYPHMATAAAVSLPYPNATAPYALTSGDSQRIFYRKGFGLPSHHQQQL